MRNSIFCFFVFSIHKTLNNIYTRYRLWSCNFRLLSVGDPTSTRDKDISLFISGCKPHFIEPVLWG